MRIEEDIKLDYSDVLIRPKRSTLPSRSVVNVSRSFNKFRHAAGAWSGTPIIAANMDTVGTMGMAKSLSKHGAVTALHKFYTIEELCEFYNHDPVYHNRVFYTFGVSDRDKERLVQFKECLPEGAAPMLCLDVANGYFEAFSAEHVPYARELFPDSIIMAGNVVTGEMTEQLLLTGADIVKVGIGPGSVCTTRKVTGVGYPQLSAVIECADAAHGMGGLVCADGGCVVPGDICKAYGAGADFVMLGGMLAGTDECGGEIRQDTDEFFFDDGKHYAWPKGEKYMEFYGMSSDTAMNKHNGGVAGYRASEGKTVRVPYKGPVCNVMQEILGGIRSMMTYIGVDELKKVSRATTFVRVNRQLNTSMNGKEI
jgi:GMP reductase